MRTFNYTEINEQKWDSEVLSLIAAIYKEAGKQELYLKQRPEKLEKLVEIAKVQSTESSNAIEGIVTTSTRIKQIMEDNADAFIVTPGGIGTFEEFFEILTLKQLCRHNKPIAIYNLNGYYNALEDAMKSAVEKNFIRENCMELYKMTDDLDALFAYIEKPVEGTRIIKELKDG